VIFLSDLKNLDELSKEIQINVSSNGALAIERFKFAMTLDPDNPQTKELREKLIEDT
jgi:hypothetical protein